MQVELADIVRGTPWWVFAVFGVLLWFGIRGLTLNARKIGVIWITPAFFIAWGVVGLVERSGSVLHWLTGALVGACLGLLVSVPVQVDPRRKLVVQPGSVIPLIRNVSLFAAHYVLNVLAAIKPHLSAHYMAYDVYVSGAGAGYFIGWASRFITSYRNAMRPDSDADVRVLSDGVGRNVAPHP
jgi:hypothetical protein